MHPVYYICTEVVLLIDFMLQIYYLSVQLQQFAFEVLTGFLLVVAESSRSACNCIYSISCVRILVALPYYLCASCMKFRISM